MYKELFRLMDFSATGCTYVRIQHYRFGHQLVALSHVHKCCRCSLVSLFLLFFPLLSMATKNSFGHVLMVKMILLLLLLLMLILMLMLRLMQMWEFCWLKTWQPLKNLQNPVFWYLVFWRLPTTFGHFLQCYADDAPS